MAHGTRAARYTRAAAAQAPLVQPAVGSTLASKDPPSADLRSQLPAVEFSRRRRSSRRALREGAFAADPVPSTAADTGCQPPVPAAARSAAQPRPGRARPARATL